MANNKEKWRKLEEFPEYEVSSRGRVRSLFKKEKKLLKPAPVSRTGYLVVCLRKNKKSHTRYVHRLVIEAFKGRISPDVVVHHKNNDRIDNRLTNLETISRSENAIESFRTKQERKLTGIQENAVDDLHRRGWSPPEIARVLNVPKKTVKDHII